MKIEIVTIREIESDEYWSWADDLLTTINEGKEMVKKAFPKFRVDLVTKEHLEKLLSEGEMTIEDDLGYTRAKTVYRIVER